MADKDNEAPEAWFHTIRLSFPDTPWAIRIAKMPKFERSALFGRIVIPGLQAVQRSGLTNRFGSSRKLPIGLFIDVTLVDYLELERVRHKLKTNFATLVLAIFDQTMSIERLDMEEEYRKRRLPGDPSTLSDRVLSTWLNEAVPSPMQDAIADLTSQVSHLQKRVDQFSWCSSALFAQLLFVSSADTVQRFGDVLDIPPDERTPAEILRRLERFFA